jgi:hypothetical protein
MSDTTSSQTHYHWTRCSWTTRRERRREKRRRSRVGELEADEADRGDEEDRVEADRGVEDVDVDSKARGVKCVYGRKGGTRAGKTERTIRLAPRRAYALRARKMTRGNGAAVIRRQNRTRCFLTLPDSPSCIRHVYH